MDPRDVNRFQKRSFRFRKKDRFVFEKKERF